MKRIQSAFRLVLILILILSFTCDHKFRNPFDPDTEIKPDEWAPANLTVTVIDDSHVRLIWTQEDSRIEGFVIERKDGNANYKEVGRTDTTFFIDDSLIINIGYTYKITAFAGNNLSTAIVAERIQTAFPAPTNLMAIAIDDQSVRLTWTDYCSFEMGFRIERKTGSGSFIQIAEVAANKTTFDNTELTYGETYAYRVRAYTQVNQSNYSNEKSAETTFPAPSNLTAIALDDQTIRLTWTDNCSFESGFRIERKTGSGNFVLIEKLHANSTEYEETGLTYGETYTYRVRAYTQVNQSGCSNENSAQMTIPAPTNLSATAIDDQTIRLTWTDNCLFELGFRIERKTGSGSFVQIAEVNANTTEYNETGLTYGETYTYRVRAFAQINQSDYSNEKSAETTFPAPANLSATALDDQTIRLIWTDNCSFEMGYRIERKTGSGIFIQVAEVNANSTEYEETGLTFEETYTYRVRAFTSVNQSDYSDVKTFSLSWITDIDGNIYKTVKIGTQIWMKENLKVTHYRNGNAIPKVTDNTAWIDLSTGAYCNYGNDVNNVTTYGRLYNWYAVNDTRNIAPTGWHVPSDAEWQTLVDYLGGENVAGGKMKETGTTHWQTPNTGATNESEFSALPGGARYGGTYDNIGNFEGWWSATEYGGFYAWDRRLNYSSSGVSRYLTSKRYGFSVRCVGD